MSETMNQTVTLAMDTVGAPESQTVEAAPEAGVRDKAAPAEPKLVPAPLPTLKRKVDLKAAILPSLSAVQSVESLAVKELKGVGANFTSNIAGVLMFFGLAHKPQGEFETRHQVLAGNLMTDPRLMGRAQRIAFVPAFSWAANEVVLMPVKLNTYGQRVLQDLQKLHDTVYPDFKAFVQWNESKRRHVVSYDALTEQEKAVIAKVKWPTQDEIVEALSASAFDNIEDLAAVNDEVRTLLHAQEVS
jgi:hypothetical protein